MKDGCRLLIKTTVFIEHFSVKEILVHGLYNSWKTFSLLYRPSTVHPLCHDAAYESCGASLCVPHAYQHPSVKPANRGLCCLSCGPCYKKGWFSCQRNQTLEEDFSYDLGWLSVTIDALVPSKAPFSSPPKLCGTLYWPPNCRWLVTVLPQGNVELHFDWFFTTYFNGGCGGHGKFVEIDDSCFHKQKCNCSRLCKTLWVFVGVEQEMGTHVLRLPLIAPLRHCYH